MRLPLLALVLLTATAWSNAAEPPKAKRASDREALAATLGFERSQAGAVPFGWGGPAGTVFADDQVKHSGEFSARIERTSESKEPFSTVARSLPFDVTGQQLELRGFVRTDAVTGRAGLWLRQDGVAGTLILDNMHDRKIEGTREWEQFTIKQEIKAGIHALAFGFLMSGTGKAWVDDLELLVDGKPIWEAPKTERLKTVVETDLEFEKSSGIAMEELTQSQIRSLTKLGKLWAFLKYHHPQVVAGKFHWDFELFRVLPAVMAARNDGEANEMLAQWIDRLGEIDVSKKTVVLAEANLHLQPEMSWIDDETYWGSELRGRLRPIYDHRPNARAQFYLSLARGVGNPIFEHELAYPKIRMPDAGYQLLALYRYWAVIRYWFPYRNLLDDSWDDVLAEFIPRIALAKTPVDYQRELIVLIGKVHDTHADLSGTNSVRPPLGGNQLPVQLRFVEQQAVVAKVLTIESGEESVFKIGDVIQELDGRPVAAMVKSLAPYYPASNEPARLRNLALTLTRGREPDVKVKLLRDGRVSEISAKRSAINGLYAQNSRTHDRLGDAFQQLSPEVAYLKLSAVKQADSAAYIDRAIGSKGLIIDLRNYPGGFLVFTIGSRLVDRKVDFATFTIGDTANPGAFRFGNSVSLTPAGTRFEGKVVILVDEVSQSNAEYTAMAFRTAPGAVVVGSTTAGADGNVSRLPLPGGVSTAISGIGVFYPDRKPTQRVGIVPDIEVRPTIAGIKAGRDEVLEVGLKQILGNDFPPDEIVRMALWPQ